MLKWTFEVKQTGAPQHLETSPGHLLQHWKLRNWEPTPEQNCINLQIRYWHLAVARCGRRSTIIALRLAFSCWHRLETTDVGWVARLFVNYRCIRSSPLVWSWCQL